MIQSQGLGLLAVANSITKEIATLAQMGVYVPVLDLTKATPADSILLRARVPATLVLRGPADLRFQSLTLTFAAPAQPLVRDLNSTEYQIVEVDTTPKEYRLPAPTYVDRIRVLDATTATVVKVVQAGRKETEPTQLVMSGSVFACGLTVTSVLAQGIPTNGRVEILSSAAASQVVVALPDGTPLHSFPAIFDSTQAVSAVTRDLAEAINKAWAEGQGNLKLTVTSMTDGRIDLGARGVWRRTALQVRAPGGASGPELARKVHPFEWVEAEVLLGTGWKKAQLRLTVDSTGKGGLATRLQPETAGRRFSVRVTESLQLAQAFRLRVGTSPDGALPALHLTGVWLCLPSVPTEEQVLDLRLTPSTADQVPDSKTIAQWEAKLPADASAYVESGTEVWFRAPCPKPVKVDGATASHSLFLVVSGHGAGTLLVHRNLGTKLEPVTQADLDGMQQPGPPSNFAPDLPGRILEGRTMVTNLSVDRTWAPLSFNCYDALWRFELELAPDSPAAPLLTASLGGTPVLAQLMSDGLMMEGTEFTWPPVVPNGPLRIRVRSRAKGEVKLRVHAEEVV